MKAWNRKGLWRSAAEFDLQHLYRYNVLIGPVSL